MATLAITNTRHWLLEWTFALLNRLVSFVTPGRPINTQNATKNHKGNRNCVLVLYASGSMLDEDWKPSRMGAAKEAAQTFCDRLGTEQPDACIAIVAFGSSGKTYCNLTMASKTPRCPGQSVGSAVLD